MGLRVLDRKEQLTLTAIEIIDELGIQNLTTRQIAQRQEISEATLFRHFKNKKELLVSVLDYFVQFDADILQSTKLHNLTPTQALSYLINSYAEYYENYPAISSILQIYNFLLYEEELADKMKEIQNNRISVIQQMIDDAKLEGEIRSNVDSDMVAVIITGFFKEICFSWKISNYQFSLGDRLLTTLELLLNSLRD